MNRKCLVRLLEFLDFVHLLLSSKLGTYLHICIPLNNYGFYDIHKVAPACVVL